MLNAIRKHTTSWVIKGLFIILILSFAVWGIGDVVTGRITGSGVARVGDTDISEEAVRSAFTREYERLREVLGAQIDHDRALSLGIHRAALESLIQDALIAEEAKALDLVATDEMVRTEVRSANIFHNSLGQFDPDIYRNVLLRNGMNEQEYLSGVRNGLIRQALTGSLVQGVRIPDPVLDPLYRFHFEQRVADTVFVSFSSARSQNTPSAEVMEQFYTANQARFMAPEYRSFSAVLLTATDLARDIAVLDDEVKAAYAARVVDYSTPERRVVRQMVFTSKEQAEAAHAQLAGGKNFDAVANELLNAQPDTLDLGTVARDELLPELAEPAFTLAKGAISGVVQSPLGWHVLTVTDIEPATTSTFEQVRDELRRELAREQALDRIFKVGDKLEDTLAGGATLEEAARALGLPLVTVEGVDATARRATGEIAADLPHALQLLDVAFTTEEGRESTLTELPDDGYFVLRVDKIVPATPRALAQVRDDVIDEWRTEQAKVAAREQAQAMLERIKSGTAPETAAQAYGATTMTTLPFMRDGVGTNLPAALVQDLFAAAAGDAVMAEGPGGVYVAQLKQVVGADPKADQNRADQLRANIADQMQNDIFVAALNAMRAEHSVRIDEQALRQLFPTAPQ
jgi:peptidyl-prolyl cis-trans isomerase D